MESEILQLLKLNKKPLRSTQIVKCLKNQGLKIDKKEFFKVLNQLEKRNEILKTPYHGYYLFDKKTMLFGKINVNKKGFGFIQTDVKQQDYYVHRNDLNGALDQDEIIFKLKRFKKDSNLNVEAVVLKIVKRNNEYIIGEVKFENDTKTKYLKINNLKLQQYKGKIVNQADAIVNTVVKGKIIDIDVETNSIEVKVIETIGSINHPGVDILAIVHQYNIRTKFNFDILNVLNNIPSEISKNDIKDIKYRTDLTEEFLVTIDGDDAKDLDDAICVSKKANGNYRLLVSVADVTNYVKENDCIDKEALQRGTSVYFVNKVIPMLPEKLSNGICSLNANELRLALTCEMEINLKGETVKSVVYTSVIKSKARLTYKQVNEFFEGKQDLTINESIKTMLKTAKDLHDIISKHKLEQGILNFDTKEAKFITNEQGKVLEIIQNERQEAEKLIENFMIRANETVANLIFKRKLSFIYRIHEYPKEAKLRLLLNQLKMFGVNITSGDIQNIEPKYLQLMLNQVSNHDLYQVITPLFLRSMEKARYDPENIGHFGLASTCYTHFTSPIRRYPDLMVHRLLKEYLIYKNVNPKTIAHYKKAVSLASKLSSINEVKAVECEREVEQMKKCEYMEQKIGNVYSGIICSITSFGIFVELENMVEGLVHVTDLNDDYYIYDENAVRLTGERTGKTYKLGDKIKVMVKNASKETRMIDFQLVK